MSVALVLALTVLGQSPDALATPPARVELVGKIREVGGGQRGEAQALLVLDDKSDRVLHASTELDGEELRRLAGVRVKVFGVEHDPMVPKGNHVRVERYEIIDVGGGAVPRIGRIAELQLDGKPRLIFVGDDGRAELLPTSWMKKMAKHTGAKLWVLGNRAETKGELTPARFAILRPGPRSAEAPTELEDKQP